MSRRIAVVAVIAAVVFGGWLILKIQRAHRPFEWSGTVEAHTIEVGSRVGGRVQNVLVREGDDVAAGQVLVVLEPGDLEGQRLAAQGQLGQAEAALEKVSTQGTSARAKEIAAARARGAAARAAAEKARIDQERNQKLFDKAVISRSELDTTRAAQTTADAQLEAAIAQLEQLVRGTPQDLKAALGQVDAAKGKLEQIDTAIDELTIRSPRRARVESLDLRPGDILAPSAVAARLLEPEELFVRIYVPETQLGHVRPGLEVPIAVDSFAKRRFKGVVESVSGVGEFTPRNLQTADERADQVFATRVRLEEGRDELRAGMAAIVQVPR